MKSISIGRATDMFKVLRDNEYSALWELVDDFTVNGHTVSVKSSTQFKHIIVDGVYQSINDKHTIVSAEGVTYNDALDFVIAKLSVKKEA